MNGNPTVISTFAGTGGSSLGYKLAGFKELLAIDFESHAVECFRANFPEVTCWQRDIKTVTTQEILKQCNISVGELDVFDGSPPCQGFSTAGKRNLNDPRNDLFLSFAELIKGLQPKVFVMENVSGMIKGVYKGKFNEILQVLKLCGYNVKVKLMNAKYYNVPQSRERLIFIGVRKDLNIEPSFPMPNKKLISVKEAWKGLPKQEVPELSPFLKEVVPKMKIGQSANDISGKGGFQTFRISPYKPCPTIIKLIAGIGFGALIHPFENRVLSVLEMKRVCSFPDEWILTGKYAEQKARLGNAVMPNMMRAIAENIKINILEKYYVNE